MDMDMVPVYEDGATAAESSAIAIDPVTTQKHGHPNRHHQRAARCGGPSAPSARLNITKTALADVTTKFKGWIEKLHVNTTGQLVMKGDPLFEI